MLVLPTVAAALALRTPLAEKPENAGPQEAQSPPNVVLVVTDDQGYGDLGSHGHPILRTPQLDALAAEGARLTQFWLPSSVCTPNRAALMTGCYPKRLGLHERVVFPPDKHGLHPDEQTLAELLGTVGYATGAFGKWHLGHRPGMLPLDQGFEEFGGLPYSNDMAQYHRSKTSAYQYRLPWLEGNEVLEWEPDQHQLTARVTRAAVSFMERHAEEPFFLYVAHPMPHLPLYASEPFEGTSAAGRYGDVLAEIDWSVGELRGTLERLGLSERTLFLFTSDNGPRHDLAGRSSGPFRGGKGTSMEGGHRVPFLAAWPGRIAPGSVVTEPVAAMDLMPTLAGMVGAQLPAERSIDGIDRGALILDGKASETAERAFLYYSRDGRLAAIRQGAWKLHFDPLRLYQLEQDLHEDRNRAAKEPERVAALEALAKRLDQDLEQGARPAGRIETQLFDPLRPE